MNNFRIGDAKAVATIHPFVDFALTGDCGNLCPDSIAIRTRTDQANLERRIAGTQVPVELGGFACSPIKPSERSEQTEISAVVIIGQRSSVKHTKMNEARRLCDVRKLASAIVVE